MLLDTAHAPLIALDLAEAHGGPPEDLPRLLKAALAVFQAATAPEDRAGASAELHLGRCTLRLKGAPA